MTTTLRSIEMAIRAGSPVFVAVCALGMAPGSAVAQGQGTPPAQANGGTQADIAVLQQQVAELQAALAAIQANPVLALGAFVHVEVEGIHGLQGPHVLFEGANLHVRSGSGSTRDAGESELRGLGNLVVGYNEIPPTLVSP